MRRPRRISPEEEIVSLRDPATYPGRVRRVSAIETHFAWVFLTARHAYKLKKALRHGSMDYRTLASRERGCREELRLNRRLAPGVYLSVLPLVRRRDGRFALAQDGEIVDWLVKMRRLPAGEMLDRVLTRRTLRAGELDRLVRLLARFFAAVERAPIVGARYLARLTREIEDNRRMLRRTAPAVLRQRAEAVAREQRRFLRRAKRLIASRGALVVEGHGDLRAEHVCLAPLCVIDRLEFSRDLRRRDPVEEIAFLSLEIDRLGHPALAADLVRRFCAATRDPAPPAVVSFYCSHRATARAKLAMWHLGDPQFPDPRPWLALAKSYLRDAELHVLEAQRHLEADGSSRIGGRPALQQRRDRGALHHARDRRAEQRRYRQHGYAPGA